MYSGKGQFTFPEIEWDPWFHTQRLQIYFAKSSKEGVTIQKSWCLCHPGMSLFHDLQALKSLG